MSVLPEICATANKLNVPDRAWTLARLSKKALTLDRPPPADFVNEPDTDFALPQNSDWGEHIVGRLEPARIELPLVVAGSEIFAGRETRPLNYDHVPGCTYCDPEIGSVGLTEKEAKERGHEVRIGTFPFGVLGRAKMAGETEGFVKIVADKTTDGILGVHMIGARSTELVAEATVAVRLESTVEELIRTVHAHPTMAEAIGEAAHAAHGAAIHS